MTQDCSDKTLDYNAKLAEDYEEIRDKVERGMLPMIARLPAIDKAVSNYVMARDEHLAGKKNPPIAYRDSQALDKFADLILYEELKWSHPDKMTIVEYPVMSDRQKESREDKVVNAKNIEYRDREHNGRRTSFFYDNNEGSRVTKPRMADAFNSEIEATGERIDLANAIERASLTERQRQALWLVYGEDMTQEQAGKAMGIRKHTVNEHITISLQKLREIFEDTPNL